MNKMRVPINELSPEDQEAVRAIRRAQYHNQTQEQKDTIAAKARERRTPERDKKKTAKAKERRHKVRGTPAALRDLDMWSQVLSPARRRAKRIGIPFEITARYMASITPDVCPVLGIPLVRGSQGCSQSNSPSMDRIVPEMGYVEGNIIVVSRLANTIRSNATPEQIIKVGQFYKALFMRLDEVQEVLTSAL